MFLKVMSDMLVDCGRLHNSATPHRQAGKFPTLVQHSDNLETKVTEVRSQVPRLVVTMLVGTGRWAMLVAIMGEKRWGNSIEYPELQHGPCSRLE